ncbi:MAG: tetratricopeptide repeat protein [Balneolaceae bacterium]
MNKVPYLLLTGFLLFAVSCQDSTHLPPLPSGVQAVSLLGDTLKTPTLQPDLFEEYNSNLIQAVMDYRVDPENTDALIWLGRRTAYLGEYREAVRIFTEGIFKSPEDPRLFRHRGHRFITLRLFDAAIQDFKEAETRMRNIQDEPEPDGLPNEYGMPTSTLKSNVWYHQGLAYYLKGDFESAIHSYRNAFNLELTDDMRIATLYWYYMSLKRLGQDEVAGLAISDVNEDLELLENDAYLNLLLVFKGVFDEDYIIESSDDALHNATIGYGIGNWHYMNGREERALEIWNDIYSRGNWPAFGFIASEAELARLRPGSVN